jgi:hypothetical protein
MASSSDIETVRLNTDEPTQDTYSDSELGVLVDANGVAGASAIVWEQKAARYAGLVNVSEAGASHSFSDLHKNAINMASVFGKQTDVVSGVVSSRTKVRKIERL